MCVCMPNLTLGIGMRICPAAGVATLTTELAQGKNMPRQNSPSNGPPTMPKMLMAALEEGGKKEESDLGVFP